MQYMLGSTVRRALLFIFDAHIVIIMVIVIVIVLVLDGPYLRLLGEVTKHHLL